MKRENLARILNTLFVLVVAWAGSGLVLTSHAESVDRDLSQQTVQRDNFSGNFKDASSSQWVYLAQGVIHEFSREQKRITLTNDTVARLMSPLQIFSGEVKYDYRILKPGVRVRLYGTREGDSLNVHKLDITVTSDMMREFHNH